MPDNHLDRYDEDDIPLHGVAHSGDFETICGELSPSVWKKIAALGVLGAAIGVFSYFNKPFTEDSQQSKERPVPATSPADDIFDRHGIADVDTLPRVRAIPVLRKEFLETPSKPDLYPVRPIPLPESEQTYGAASVVPSPLRGDSDDQRASGSRTRVVDSPLSSK